MHSKFWLHGVLGVVATLRWALWRNSEGCYKRAATQHVQPLTEKLMLHEWNQHSHKGSFLGLPYKLSQTEWVKTNQEVVVS